MSLPKIDRLLVTGGCGFIGANFIRYLLEESDFLGHIVNLDALTYAGNQESLAGLPADRYQFIHGDIRDRAAVDRVIDEHQIDGICHVAAESHVDRSIVEPAAFIETNIVGTYNLLESVRERKGQIHIFHHVSTDEVFGSLGPTGAFTEESPYRPNSPYSASKAASDHLVRAYHMTYGLPVTMSNCSNNYGPYQFPEKLMPLVILNLLEGKEAPVYGDGKHRRDWLYVRDHCEALWLVMQEGQPGETYNMGGDAEEENLRIVEMIADLLDEKVGVLSSGPRRERIKFVVDRPGHDRRYAIDWGKIHRELEWSPRHSLREGLGKTVEWYLSHSEWVERVRSGEYQRWIAQQYAP